MRSTRSGSWTTSSVSSLDVTHGRPGTLGDIVAAHGRYYTREWGFGTGFEAKVAEELADFASRKTGADLLPVAYDEDAFAGSIVIDRSVTGGVIDGHEAVHLRWFITTDTARGRGLGRFLMERAMRFCDERGYTRVWLTTFSGLAVARRLYEAFGFRLVSENDVDQWGGGVSEQRFERG